MLGSERGYPAGYIERAGGSASWHATPGSKQQQIGTVSEARDNPNRRPERDTWAGHFKFTGTAEVSRSCL